MLKQLWLKCTPWWLLAWSPLLLIGALFFSPPARAISMTPPLITVNVSWTGTPACITIFVPAGGDYARPINACSLTHTWATSYMAPAPGQWVGVDPEMSGADTLSCTLAVNSTVIIAATAGRGDGTEVTCLIRW
jgi:hypothetical protein